MSNSEIVALMGPTASGKTALAMALYDHYPVDIISVDSGLIYRGMDIGTAKPSKMQLAAYPHQLINIIDPIESYSAARFCCDAIMAVKNSLAKGRIPLLVGGTMLYFKAFFEGLSPLPAADPIIRQRIAEEASNIGWPALYARAEQIDPFSAKRIHPNDRQRLSRLLEVYLISGKPLSKLIKSNNMLHPYRVKKFALIPENKSEFHGKIIKRFYSMLEQGFENEVIQLMARGNLSADFPSMRCVGYRQMWDYLSGNSHYDEMVLKTINATKQLAKRQITWLRSWSGVTKLTSDSIPALLESISAQLV